MNVTVVYEKLKQNYKMYHDVLESNRISITIWITGITELDLNSQDKGCAICTLHVANEIEKANVAALVGDRPGKLFTDDTANK